MWEDRPEARAKKKTREEKKKVAISALMRT